MTIKLTKDQQQQIILAAIVVIAALYCYFTMLLGPLNLQELTDNKDMVALQPKIDAAAKQINRTRNLETADPNEAVAKAALEVMKAAIPEDASVAWIPQKMADFFRRQSISKATCHLGGSETTDADLPGYRISPWTAEFTQIDFNTFSNAVTALENENGLLQITSITINASPSDVLQQHAQFNFLTPVKPQQ